GQSDGSAARDRLLDGFGEVVDARALGVPARPEQPPERFRQPVPQALLVLVEVARRVRVNAVELRRVRGNERLKLGDRQSGFPSKLTDRHSLAGPGAD